MIREAVSATAVVFPFFSPDIAVPVLSSMSCRNFTTQ